MRSEAIRFVLLGSAAASLLAGCQTPPEPAPPPAPPPVIVQPPPPPPPPLPPPPPPPPVVVTDPYGTILAGVLDLPRSPDTEATRGCAKVHKGLTIGGGFLMFTCERLREGLPIGMQADAAQGYGRMLELRGWEARYNERKKLVEYHSTIGAGCRMTVSIRPWTDRTMNEPRPASREGFRQIVFTTSFAKGPACEPTYQRFKRGDLLDS